MKKLVVYYDGKCEFCLKCVNVLKKIDHRKILTYQSQEEELDTVIFEEGDITWKYAKAVFRIFWVIGGFWKIIGVLHFLPKILIDPFYKIIAKNRSCK